MSSPLGDKKGRSADSSDLTRLKRESVVLAAYTTYTGLSVNKKSRQQVGTDRKFTLGRGGLTLKADATTGVTRNPITGGIILPPYTYSPTVYTTLYAIPDFSIATYVSGDGSGGSPYTVSSGGKQYSVSVSSTFADNYTLFGGQKALMRQNDIAFRWVSGPAYAIGGGGTPQSLIISAPSPFVLTSYSLLGPADSSCPSYWSILGSSDGGATYTTIDTKSAQYPTTLITYSLPNNTTPYSTYKLYITNIQGTAGAGSSLSVLQFNLFYTVASQ